MLAGSAKLKTEVAECATLIRPTLAGNPSSSFEIQRKDGLLRSARNDGIHNFLLFNSVFEPAEKAWMAAFAAMTRLG